MLAGLQRCYETQYVCFWVVFFCSVFLNRNAHTLLTTPADLHPAQRVEPVGPNLLGRISLTSAKGSVPEPAKIPARTPFTVRGYDRLVHLVRFVPQHVNTKCNQTSQNRPDGATNVSNYIWSHQLHNMNHFKLLVNLQALKRIVCYETYP